MFRISILSVLALLLSACGFQMQGAFKVPQGMERTYILTEDRYSLFYRELRRQLQENGVQLADTPEDSTAVLTIHMDRTGQRVLSVSARNVPTEYEIFYRVQYSVDSGEENLLSRQYVYLTKDYTYDETLVLGKSSEEALLRDTLAGDLVRIVLKQLETW